MIRAARLLALAALAAAGCNADAGATCPGAPIGTHALTGTLRSATCGDPPAASAPFQAALPPSFGPRDVTFSAGGADAVAVCTGPRLGAVLYGTRTGDRVTVSASSEGAVLTGCAPTCSAVVTYRLDGDLAVDGSGAVTGFTGTYAETFTPAPGSACGGCILPCAAVYDVPGAP